MTLLNTPRAALSLVLIAALAACGGGETRTETLQATAAPLSGAPSLAERMRALTVGGGSSAAAAVNISNAQFFEWATLQFAALFPANPVPLSLTAEGLTWDIRAYSNGNYLAIASNGRAYGLGPVTGNTLVDLGVMQAFAEQVCSSVNCGGGGGGGGTGALNGCTLPASEALRTGNSITVTYVNTLFSPVSSSGEHTVTGTINGPAAFEGQSAIKLTSRVTGFQSGETVDATIVSYERAAANELTETLGSEIEANVAGFALTLRSVFNPFYLNEEFTLQPGGSLTKTISSTQTYLNAPFPIPPSSGSSTSTITYEARETISVLGRSYETCRYKDVGSGSNTTSYTWYIVGKGIPAREESRNASGTVLERTELKSGTLNGSPL